MGGGTDGGSMFIAIVGGRSPHACLPLNLIFLFFFLHVSLYLFLFLSAPSLYLRSTSGNKRLYSPQGKWG